MASYKKLKSGWRYRQKYKDPFTKEMREKSESGFKTKVEAELAAANFLKRLRRGIGLEDQPLVEYIEFWIENYHVGTSRKNTIKQHKNNLNTHIKPYFKNLMLQDLTPDIYQVFLNSLLDGGLSRRTVEIINSTMFGALERAVMLNKLERNPIKGTAIRGKPKEKKTQFIESADIPKFLYAARKYGYIYWMFFKLLIETGLRSGEAAALKWTDINFKEKTIHVYETLDFQADDFNDPKKLFGPTKTSTERYVSISNSLIKDLKFHATWQNQNKLHMDESIYRHDLNLVLCRPNGAHMPKSSLFNAYKRILRKAGLDQSLKIHSLRHTYAVLMLEAGADMKFVQEQLGHSGIQITSDVYAHISKKLEKRSMERFEEYTSSILSSDYSKLGD